jgi:hypothetical protein
MSSNGVEGGTESFGGGAGESYECPCNGGRCIRDGRRGSWSIGVGGDLTENGVVVKAWAQQPYWEVVGEGEFRNYRRCQRCDEGIFC